MSEDGGDTLRATEVSAPRRAALVHHLIVCREPTGSEVPHTFPHSGEEVLAVFSSGEAARRFLCSRALDEGWYVREYSAGELVSLLFAHHERLGGILVDPLPGRHLADHEDLWSPMSRDGFIEFLISG